MIYITGDTHGDFTRFSAKRLRRTGMELTKEDYIIICGDFGLCWAKDKTFEYHCKNFAEKPYTILWVQGNHENYDMIGEYPLEEWHGGKARHIIRDCQPDERHTLVYYAILPLEQKESVNAVPVPGKTEGETNHGKR